MTQSILCPVCGESYSPHEGHNTCSACPFHQGCSLVRCPHCGFETVDPYRSTMVRLIERLFNPPNRRYSSGSYHPGSGKF